MNRWMRGVVGIGSSLAWIFLVFWSADAFGPRSFTFALLVNWLTLSWMAAVGQVLTVPLPTGYYRIRPFERDGRLYERLGIRPFQRFVRSGPLTLLSPTLRLPQGRASLVALEKELRKAEAGHALVFLIVAAFAAGSAVRGWFDLAAWLLLLDLPINVYPVMLQRYNRIRLQRISAQRR